MIMQPLFAKNKKVKIIEVQRWFQQHQNGYLAHCIRILIFYLFNCVTDSFLIYPSDVNFKFFFDISESQTTTQSIVQENIFPPFFQKILSYLKKEKTLLAKCFFTQTKFSKNCPERFHSKQFWAHTKHKIYFCHTKTKQYENMTIEQDHPH